MLASTVRAGAPRPEADRPKEQQMGVGAGWTCSCRSCSPLHKQQALLWAPTGCLSRAAGSACTRPFPACSMPAVAQPAFSRAHPPCAVNECHWLNRLQRSLGLDYIFYENKLALLVLMSSFNDCCSTSIHSNFEMLEKQFAAYRFLMRQVVVYAGHTCCHTNKMQKCKQSRAEVPGCMETAV